MVARTESVEGEGGGWRPVEMHEAPVAYVQSHCSRLASVLWSVLPLGALSADATTGSILSPLGSAEIQKVARPFTQGDTLGREDLETRSEIVAHWQMGVGQGSMAGAV
jgi:hypothetical protein